MKVYLSKNDEQFGPYSLEQIQAFIDTGSFSPIDSAWFEGCEDWTTISYVPGVVIPEEKLRQHLVPPFEAYAGDNPYVFVSYAHSDGELVFREIKKLHQAGYRIWYDEGIEPGDDWPDHIANSVINCSLFLIFTSPRSAASKNCRNEVNLALNRKKKFLAIHLENTELPPGLELRMGDLQAILKFRMPTATYRKKLFAGLEKMMGEDGRDLPEGEDPVAAAMAIEVDEDYLAAPVENAAVEVVAPLRPIERAKAKGKGLQILVGLGIVCFLIWLFFFLFQAEESALEKESAQSALDVAEELDPTGDQNRELTFSGDVETKIEIIATTSKSSKAGTDSKVFAYINGLEEERFHLNDVNVNDFEEGARNTFSLLIDYPVSSIENIEIRVAGKDAWKPASISFQLFMGGKKSEKNLFQLNEWFSSDPKDAKGTAIKSKVFPFRPEPK